MNTAAQTGKRTYHIDKWLVINHTENRRLAGTVTRDSGILLPRTVKREVGYMVCSIRHKKNQHIHSMESIRTDVKNSNNERERRQPWRQQSQLETTVESTKTTRREREKTTLEATKPTRRRSRSVCSVLHCTYRTHFSFRFLSSSYIECNSMALTAVSCNIVV